MEKQKLNLALFGDLVRHVVLKPAAKRSQNYAGFVREAFNPLIPEMVAQSLNEPTDPMSLTTIPSFVASQAELTQCDLEETYTVLEFFPEDMKSRRDGPKVLRIKAEYFSHHLRGALSTGENPAEQFASTYISMLQRARREGNGHQVSVIYDRNSLFRQSMMQCPDLVNLVTANISQSDGGLMLAVSDEITTDWIELLCDITAKHGSQFETRVKPRSVAVINADSLRKCGFPISWYASIEATIRDVVKSLDSEPLCSLRKICDNLVVIFRETGGVHIDHVRREGSISWCPNYDRYLQETPARFGSASGKFSIVVAAIIREMCRSIDTPPEHLNIASALRLATAAYNLHFKSGYKEEGQPLDAIRNALSVDRRKKLRDELLKDSKHLPTTLSFRLEPVKNGTWRRYNDWFESLGNGYFKTEDELLTMIVQRGLDYAFRDQGVLQDMREKQKTEKPMPRFWCPEPVIGVPYARFGTQDLVDWHEIEQYSNLAKLIKNYLSTPTPEPLSIAVFGQPGSGKSFAVKQIVRAVDPHRKSEPLTFNLAQFSSTEQLTDAFHKVQDQALSSLNETPLVIFDEFDCAFATPLGWLKYFLAPMQDGLFRGRGEDYRVGRAIFLFSGGTAHSFHSFVEGVPRNKEYKLGDFVSRLRGHLDVGNINPPADKAPDLGIRMRRAILLRSLLERRATAIMQPVEDQGPDYAWIDKRVVHAFLHTREFLHGVRSMEAIIQMSRMISGRFLPASLPAQDQLSMHVDDSFSSLIDRSGYT